jgi:patatin-like phospholipase/acyl hydrolase
VSDGAVTNDSAKAVTNQMPFTDGGGVRGLSTLLILQDLMSQINVSLRNLRDAEDLHRDVEPYEIFDLVAGTSTGGLIAVMLGKLGMTIDQCIAAYRDLSRTIFGAKHVRGRLTFGLAPSRYSGSRLRKAVYKLLGDRGFADDLSMTYVQGRDKIAW